MARSPQSEANYKAYQKKYHAERNARARYAYETLEKENRVVVNGKDLSAELMHTRAPGVTGETPWEKDLSIHPLKWRRQGMPKDLPITVMNAFGDEAPGRSFTDPRMLFDASLFDNMTDEEIAYFNDEKHWVVPGPEKRDRITLDTELENEPGVYGYLVHTNRGRKEVNNPPAGRPTYKRKDGKVLVWDDPRLDAPYWQECGDYMFTYLNEQEAREAFKQQKLHLYDLNQEVRLYRLTKPINLGEARAWLNCDHPLREKEHGAITLDAFGTGQYDNPGALRLPQQPAPDEDEQDRIAEEAYWNSLTPEEQQKILHDQDYYEKLEEERWQINQKRCEALERFWKERYNIDDYVNQHLQWALEEAAEDPDDVSAVHYAKILSEQVPVMPLDEKLLFIKEDMYPTAPSACEEVLRKLNIVTPYETLTHLVDVMPLNQETIEHAVKVHKMLLKKGTETKKLGFRRKGGQYHLNEEQEKYVRAGLVDRFTRQGERASAELLMYVYHNEWYRCLDAGQIGEINGFSWETINMDDYLAGHLLTYGDDLPYGAFAPKHDRIEFLADLLTRGEIDVPTFWKRVEASSYVRGLEQFGPDGEEPFIITKKNWRQCVKCWDEGRPEGYVQDPVLDLSSFPESLGGGSFETYEDRLCSWRTKDWEAWIDSLPDDWWVVNSDAVAVASYQVEDPTLVPEMVDYYVKNGPQVYSY
ncbi:hypothetical protein HMPREF2942_00055 [Rothia sp. HMSC071C12]|uniref:hypothetical protein n=1 Tax=Rothia sp. HMSC071C12 TaxID=1739446 RepID=UPI0008A3FA41|nr:hypothetical protein [Rothia sp. HMSC071C12]OFQ37930.1 hypothetical protein HMPREF2942_00055 [Rothia sp. HMSC071C12]